jgi:hypothetical protein
MTILPFGLADKHRSTLDFFGSFRPRMLAKFRLEPTTHFGSAKFPAGDDLAK